MFRGGIQPIIFPGIILDKHLCSSCDNYVHKYSHALSNHYFPILCKKCKEHIRKDRSNVLSYCNILLPTEVSNIILQHYDNIYSGIDNDKYCRNVL
jgi:hypothetical protein